MRARHLPLVLLVVLGVGCVVLARRVLEHREVGGRGRWEVGLERTTALSDATRARLATLDAELNLTYFVSPRAEMPSSMRDVERTVTDLLEALRAAAPGRVDFQVVDPEEREDLGSFTQRRRVAPFRVRTVERDAYSERSVFSTLSVSYGARPEVAIHGIGPEHLPRLQALLVEHLDRLEDPARVRVALAAPPGFDELADLLAADAEVLRVDLDAGEPLPDEADVLFWMAPRTPYPETLVELDRFLERGKSLVLAGARHELGPGALRTADGSVVLQLDAPASGFAELATHLGLEVRDGLVSDERSDVVVVDGAEHAAPFLVRCIAPNQDFQRWREQPNGTLLFLAPSPLAPAPAKLAERRRTAHVLGTTSDETRLGTAPVERAVALAELGEGFGVPTPKLPLIVGLEADDPWQGEVVVFGATTPFEDGALSRRGVAHPRLVRTLLDHVASPERLVASQAEFARPAPLPPLSRRERVWWRAACVFLVPLLLGAYALRTVGLATLKGTLAGTRRARGVLRGAPLALLGLGAVLGVAVLARGTGVEADVTSEGLHGLPKDAVGHLAEALAGREVDATLFVSNHAALPPAWRPAVRRLRERLDRFADAGLLVGWREDHPDELDDAGRAALLARGIEPVEVTTADEGTTTVRSFFCTLELGDDGQRQLLPFRELRGFDEPDFALALALDAVAHGRRRRVAFASDVPRLSAAEAYEDFQQKGLFAPLGADVYSLARAALGDLGFDVVHVNPREPELPSDVDALVWMQPRRTVTPMLTELARHVVGGGRALLAAQHFVIQARQYRGTGFEHVYWPQPQSNDLEHLWLPELGIRLEREVLFDERSTRIQQDTRVTGRRAGRDVEVQDSALPFLIRTSSANSNQDSTITRGLGDQAFLWGDAITWDEARLAELGIVATPLITTSERSWSFPWKGGYLPPEVLAGPIGEAGFRGKLPLAVRFDGTFPTPVASLSLDALTADEPFAPDAAWPTPAPGTLVLVGGSHLFRNERLYDEEFRARDLLVDAVATLACDPPLAALAARRPVPRGFDYVAPERRLRWRAAVVAAPPIVLVLTWLVVALLRRRAPVRASGGRTS